MYLRFILLRYGLDDYQPKTPAFFTQIKKNIVTENKINIMSLL